MKKKFLKLFFCTSIGLANAIFAQSPSQSVSGNFQIDAANYNKDTIIGADPGSQVVRYNSFGNINYSSGDFSAGVRFESYQPPLLGYLPGYTGTGIPYKYARYRHKDIDITVGSFYEQFGSGLCFRSYEDRGLLYDNAMNGMRIVYTPQNGVTLKGFVGKQRTYFDLSPGTVRGIDGEVNLTQLLNDYRTAPRTNDSGVVDSSKIKAPLKTQVIVGGSFVSKFQSSTGSAFVLPENVGCGAGRLNIIRGTFNFSAEGVYKINDPSYQNKYSYKDGKGLYVSSSYATEGGLTFLVTGKVIDNMFFKSNRDETAGIINMINYSPSLTKNHTYMMMAYVPYASQLNGEMGGSGEIQYKFKKGTFLGGKYGMDVTLNGSIMYAPDTIGIGSDKSDSSNHYLYKVDYFSLGKKYFHDINIEINKKINKHVKFTLMYSNQYINQAQVQYNTLDKELHPDVNSNIFVLDVTWKYRMTKAIRFEAQTFQTDNKVNDFGNKSWVTGLIEWTPSSNWFFCGGRSV